MPEKSQSPFGQTIADTIAQIEGAADPRAAYIAALVEQLTGAVRERAVIAMLLVLEAHTCESKDETLLADLASRGLDGVMEEAGPALLAEARRLLVLLDIPFLELEGRGAP